MKTKLLFCMAAAGVCFAGTADAHHSRAMFDLEKRVEMKGTVKKFDWANPHVYILVVNDKAEEWSLETRGPGVLSRHGWNFKSLAAGDKIDIVMAPLTDGRHGGLLITLKKADGKVLSGEGGDASGG